MTAFEAKTRFGNLLERVSRGEAIVITRHDKPVARVIPEGRGSLEDVQAAVQELRRIREALKKRPGFRRLTNREIRDALQCRRCYSNSQLRRVGGGFISPVPEWSSTSRRSSRADPRR